MTGTGCSILVCVESQRMVQEWVLLCWDVGRDRMTQRRMLTGSNLAVGFFQVRAGDGVTGDGTAAVVVTVL